MSRWALVIGSQTGDLEGVDRDAGRIADALSGRGFVVDLRTGPRATRAGILAGYRAVIEHARTTGPDTTAAIYYVRRPRGVRRGPRARPRGRPGWDAGDPAVRCRRVD